MTLYMLEQEKYEEGLEEGLQKGLQKGKREGLLEALANLVSDGLLSAAEAARRAGMNEEAFKSLMK